MSLAARFLGKMFIARGGNYFDRYNLDGIGGTHFYFNVYANGRQGTQFTGVACQGIEPVTGPGKPSDLKHLMRGQARVNEPASYVPLVAGADADTGLFSIDFTQVLPVFHALGKPLVIRGATIPWEIFNCWSAFRFGTIYWWWGAGWINPFVSYQNQNAITASGCNLFSYTPTADDWRHDRTYRPSVDYEWCDLSGEDYSHLALSDAKFGNADLTGTDLTGCDLSNIDFRGVHAMKRAKLANAKLDGANLSGVDLEGVDLSGASLIGADLSHTDLMKAIFHAPPTLSHDINRRTSFAHSKVPWGALHDAGRDGNKIDLTALVLAYAVIDSVPEDLRHLDASNADVRGVVFTNRNLRAAKFVHAHAEAIDLTGSMLAGASFEFAFLGSDGRMSASLANADLMDANFSNADLTGAVLTGCRLWGSSATLSKATLVQTNFADAYLAAADFREIAGKQCSGVDFSGACLVNADFRGTTTQHYDSAPTNFVNACLQGANFDGAKLIDTNLANASVSFQTGTFPATVLMRWPPQPVPLDPPLTYDATIGLASATTATTTCPSSGPGPCTDSQLHIGHPVTSWPPLR